MKNTKTISCQLGEKTMTFETGLLARQAAGALTIQLGETMLFSAVTAAKEPREGASFFPLQVEYREKFYSAGRFPGGYFKREARPSEKEVLTMRVTDRPLRPLFPSDYLNEVQIHNTVFSVDGKNEPDILSMNAASAALTISEIPFRGPVGAVRVGRVEGEFIVCPTHQEIEKSDLDLIYCATRELPVMIEGAADEVPEEVMVAAMKFAHEHVIKIIDAQLELRRALGLPDKVVPEDPENSPLVERMRELAEDKLMAAMEIGDKTERSEQTGIVRNELQAALLDDNPEMTDEEFRGAFGQFESSTVRRLVLEKGKRIGSRAMNELRELDGQVSILPRTHGSAVFSRGETQALGVVTLGSGKDAQMLDAVTGGNEEKTFMVHYNFPPYSVGEVGRLGFTSRREIGHGNLAERCLCQVMPRDYPYSVRLVSEIMGSNGSSSMASVCVGSMALMDAGIPIKAPVAGISIGLFSDGDRAELVTDILGSEDHHGDMDFKVAGTRKGITGFQVDLKIRGLRWDLVENAFEMARDSRLEILDFIEGIIPASREELSPLAPRIAVVKIPVDKIGALIGPGGKHIRALTDTYDVQIDIEDDGTVKIYSSDGESMAAAKREIELLTAEAEINTIYRGTVTGVKDFGCFVEIFPGKEGLVHISELADFRVRSVDEICKVGDPMWVKCIGVDDASGKIRLSRREALKDKGEETD